MSRRFNFDSKLKKHEDVLFNDGKFLPQKAAKFLMEDYDFLTVDENEEIFVRNSNQYKPKGESIVKQEVQRVLPEDYKRVTLPKSQTVSTVQDWTRIPRDEFTEPPRYINLENGVYDFEEDEFIKEDVNLRLRHKLPINYDPDAEPDKVLKVVNDIVRDEDVDLIQEMFGYCIFRDYPFNKAFMLLGKGSNGKSTLLNILQEFLGDENIANPSLQTLLKNDYNKHHLYKKLANINADIPSKALENTSIFKNLTGEDKVFGEKKHSNDAMQFKNYAKLIYSANELPKTTEFTDAFFRRWIIIEFPYKFTNNPDDRFKNKDPDVLKGLFDEEEMSGLFNWALEGLKRIFRQNGFSTSEGAKNVKKRWLLLTDSLRSFVEYHCEAHPDYLIPKDEFMKIYKYYCKAFDVRYRSKNKVGRDLPEILPVEGSRRKIDGETKRVWMGLRVKDLDFLSDEFDDLSVYCKDNEVTGFKKVDLSELTDISEVDEVDDDNEMGLRDSLLKTVENEGEVGFDELVDMFADAFDKDEEFVEGLIATLKDDGVLFEPRPGFLKKL